MSGIGKTATGFKKREYAESRSIARAQKTLKFAHAATLGQSTIDLASLVAPVSMASLGFVNPNPADLAAAELLTHRNNLRLTSSVNGLLDEYVDYVVTGNSSIQLVAPYTAASGEVFIGVLEGVFKTGTIVTDAMKFATTDTLAVGATDILLGYPVPITGTTGSQIPSIAVFRNGRLQIQNEANSPGGTGNYYLVPTVSGGVSYTIRFNVAGVLLPDGSTESVAVFPIGYIPTTTDSQTLNLTLTAAYDAIVGSSAQLLDGKATHSSINSAISSVPSGGKIYVLRGTFTENVSVNKEVMIEGMGRGTVIDGTLTLTSSSDYALVRALKVTGNITLDSGSTGIFLRDCWVASGSTVTDNGSGNSVLVIQE
jgi:hypothetical protein